MATNKRNFTSEASNAPTRTIKNPKVLQSKSKTHKVTPHGNDLFTVESGASGNTYTVNFTPEGCYCSCPWGEHRPMIDRRSACSHVLAVYDHIAAEAGRKVSAWSNEADAKRQKKTRLDIGDGVHITARLQPAPILWTIQGQNQPDILEVIYA